MYRAVGDGPHPAVALAYGVAVGLAMCFADEGFTAIVFTEPDDYPSVVTWATTQGDIDDANLFGVVPKSRRLAGTERHERRSPPQRRDRRHDVGSSEPAPIAALMAPASTRTPVISYPVLVIVGGTEDYERLVRRMANRVHRIEVYVATSRARTVGVEIDFLRFHSGLPATMHEVC